jgi:hypothetical protein
MTEPKETVTEQTTETAGLSPWLACVLCGAELHPVRPGWDTCKRCRRLASRGARADEREWLGRYVTDPQGSGQVVSLAPEHGHVWVTDGSSFRDCETTDLVRLDDHLDVHQETLW